MIELVLTTNMNLEFKNLETISRVESMCVKLSITPEEFIVKAIKKLLSDLEFVHELRNYNEKKSSFQQLESI